MRALITALVLAVTVGTVASADQAAKPYAPITSVGLRHPSFDVCATACAGAAERERAKLGPAPAAPLYRVSATQAAATRANLVKATATRAGIPEAEAAKDVPAWDQSLIAWRDAEPKGDYNPNDAADVLAKYWLFAWIYGGGVDPKAVTAQMVDGVRVQTHRLFADDRTLAPLTEGQRQGLADVMMRQLTQDTEELNTLGEGALLGVGPDEQGVTEIEDDIVAHFQSMFDLDLLKLSLTYGQGFVVKTNP